MLAAWSSVTSIPFSSRIFWARAGVIWPVGRAWSDGGVAS